MRNSLTASLENQRPENPANFVVGRVVSKLRDCQHIGSFGKLGDFIVVRKVKTDFHSVNRNGSIGAEASLPCPHKSFKHSFDVFGLGVVAKRLYRQSFSFVHQGVAGGAVHFDFSRLLSMPLFFSMPVTTTDNFFYRRFS